MRHYCTYFDHRYLPRGLAMMGSIRRFDPHAHFFVLALDDKCKQILDALGDTATIAIPLTDLEAADPELRAVKAARSAIEYYFTCTPCFPHHLMTVYGAEIEALTYLDSDLLFYADPEIVYREIGDASVAITPHRFSTERTQLVRYGRFNVGWITWRNDEVGRRCLSDYRADCIAWCYDRLEGDRFADQKYLDKWPALYPGVKELDHPGINTASWNINDSQLSEVQGQPFIDDKPVVFWHFHSTKKLEDGWAHAFDQFTLERHPNLLYQFFLPYVTRLDQIEDWLRTRIGFAYEGTSYVRYTGQPSEATAPTTPAPGEWRHVGAAWPAAQPSDRDDEALRPIRQQQWEALAALHDADAVGTSPAEQFNTLVACDAVQVAWLRRGTPPLSILDWGGDVGLLHHRLRRLYPRLALDYTVKGMAPLCRLGRKLEPAVRFVDSEEEAFNRRYDLVIAGAALHHAEDWRAMLARLAAVTEGCLLLACLPTLRQAPSYVAQQGAPGTVLTGWILNEGELLQAVAATGLRVVRRTTSGASTSVVSAPEQPLFMSYLLEPMGGGA